MVLDQVAKSQIQKEFLVLHRSSGKESKFNLLWSKLVNRVSVQIDSPLLSRILTVPVFVP